VNTVPKSKASPKSVKATVPAARPVKKAVKKAVKKTAAPKKKPAPVKKVGQPVKAAKSKAPKKASAPQKSSAVKKAAPARKSAPGKKSGPAVSRIAAKTKAVVKKAAGRAPRHVYFFGDGKADGSAEQKNLLGGKGANLAEMTRLGIPVPPGFTITTEVCTYYFENKNAYPPELESQVSVNLKKIEKLIGKGFGDPVNPLLVSVRSGGRASMPGMMDTILNLGLNDATVKGLIERTGDARFAYDAYRRFVQMYASVVLGVKMEHFEPLIDELKEQHGYHYDTEITAEEWASLIPVYKKKVKDVAGVRFPEDPQAQLWGAVSAVFQSWMNERAITYRKLNNIPASWGTAVNVQSMVFGNMGDDCATGVAFTRDPSTGRKMFFGEYLPNAQGEDVVAGIRTPRPINEDGSKHGDLPSLEATMPKPYQDLVRVYKTLEKHYRDMQDIEFTIEKGKLWLLQTRNGKRTAAAAIKIAVDMVKERLITAEEAIMRVEPAQLDQLLHPRIDPNVKFETILKALPASPGAAVGRVVFHAAEAEVWAKRGEPVILVRRQTSPEDIGGFHVAQGILTSEGGMTSHAAVVARGMGKCCVVGAKDMKVSEERKTATIGALVLGEGDWITVNGSTGEVYLGKLPTIQPTISGDFEQLMKWADKFGRMKIRTNADTAHDCEVARGFGAEGIGLCRTEHMFFEGDRIDYVREMILAEDLEARRSSLEKLRKFQREDFKGILKAMAGYPVTIRLLDPPLHEFLPQTDKDFEAVSQKSGISVEQLKAKAQAMHESNPMLGHRGCRLAITYPEIYEMQVRAIMEAACDLKKAGVKVFPEIMHPIVGFESELKFLRELTVRIADKVQAEKKINVAYTIGTMIELPRAALTADEIARQADFFSFGTNDLTQTTLGMSRDDAPNFLGYYEELNIIPGDPFASIDSKGVAALVRMGFERGRLTKPNLKVGVCGEHGGDPASIEIFEEIGLDYVSCSPFRVPIARLSAAQASLRRKGARGSSTA
jgi:pyruvate, orthophosphate dikinase